MHEINLICPICSNALNLGTKKSYCNGGKRHYFPVINNIPILINDRESIFKIKDFTFGRGKYFSQRKKNRLIEIAGKVIPSISANFVCKSNFSKLAKKISSTKTRAKILIIGSGYGGNGIETITENKKFQILNTDVYLGQNVSIVCDAHNLPFITGTFDCVIIQAVIEHLADPEKAVTEIYRVLKKNGWAYFETSFMQQNHGGEYDFKRYTFRGHMNLLSGFNKVEGGTACGPAMALSWSWLYFWNSFSDLRIYRYFVNFIVRISIFWLKYLDIYLNHKNGSREAASAFFFFARK
jgi:SAM-dependent methyltransferase